MPGIEEKAGVKESQKPSPNWNLKNKFASLLLILLGLLAVVFIGAFFIKKTMEPLDISRVLPKEYTVAMASLNGNGMDALSRIDEATVESLRQIIEEALNADFEKDIKPWLGDKHGYALLKIEGEKNIDEYAHVLFIESIDRWRTLDFLGKFQLGSLKDGLTEEKYKNYSIYSFTVGQNVSFMPLDKYFVFARNTDVLEKIIDVKTGDTESLNDDENFISVRNNLKKDIGFAYYVPAKLFDYYIGEEMTSVGALIRPVLSLFAGQGHSFILNDNALIVQTYIHFNAGQSGVKLPEQTSHYKGNLLNIIPPHYEYFWGSRDLSKVVEEFGAVLNQLHPSSFNILEGVLNAKKEQYFGYEIDLREDIYKVFENEFALGLYSEPDHIDYLFVAERQSQDHIGKLQGYYMAKAQERGYKILEENVPAEEGSSKSDQISVFPFDGRTNMYTAMHKNIFIMSTSIALIEDTLTHIDEGGIDREELVINSYLKDFDEVNIASPAFMGALLGEKWNRYLSNFTRIQAAKSIFGSGIALVHVFEF